MHFLRYGTANRKTKAGLNRGKIDPNDIGLGYDFVSRVSKPIFKQMENKTFEHLKRELDLLTK